MARNVVVCCDGTANEFAADRTNVAKLCHALVKDPERQLVYYHPGIGTMAPPGFGTGLGAWAARSAGAAFGYRLQEDIARAYAFIMNHWMEGDRLFLFGFSRGAYTARVVAALIHMYGLVMPGNEGLVPYLVRMLWKIHSIPHDGSAQAKKTNYFALAHQFKDSMAVAHCKPHFLGVWDTVSSVGWIGSPVALPYTKDNPDVIATRHAVAIDERRAFFRTNLFSPDMHDLREVWFPGVHCDVGGGYPERASGLSKYALAWMADEARHSGLLLDGRRLDVVLGIGDPEYAPRSPDARIHDSMTPRWRIAEFVPKRYWDKQRKEEIWRLNLFQRRDMGKAPIVHDVAWQIPGAYADRLPADVVKLSTVWPT